MIPPFRQSKMQSSSYNSSPTTKRTYRSREQSLQKLQMKNMAERVKAIEVRAFENFKKRKGASSSHSKLLSKLEVGFKYNPK